MMRFFSKMKLFAGFIILFSVVSCQNLRVKVEQGDLIGTTYPLINGRTIFAFKGIPYAAPITQKNRFKEPQPLKPWVGIWNASTYPPSCLQYSHLTYTVLGEEDCLYLNVYTPKLPERGVSPQLNVIFYIHGGAFMFANGQDFHPDYLLERNDIILVTVNYRLGILGFFSSGDSVVPGNNGLKDQVAALKWVRNNIAQFGGNPASITIAGCSAGGASVHYHMLSPMTDGLFQKAISFSGTTLPPWTLPRNNTEKSIRLAEYVGCGGGSVTKDMVDCLRARPAHQIVAAQTNFMTWKYTPFSPFGPTVEPASKNSFLSEDPVQTLKNGRVKKVPWLTSLMEYEGLYPASEFIPHESLLIELDEKWDEIAPNLLMYNFSVSSEEEKIKVGAAIREFYFGANSVPNSVQQIVQAVGDRLFYNDIVRAIKLQVSQTKQSNAYCYVFSYRGKYSVSNVFAKNNVDYGASHSDDIFFVFKTFPYRHDETVSDAAMMDLLCSIIVTFAESGNPSINNMAWEPVSTNFSESLRCLEIASPHEPPVMRDFDNKRTIEFWKNLLPSEYSVDDEVHSWNEEL